MKKRYILAVIVFLFIGAGAVVYLTGNHPAADTTVNNDSVDTLKEVDENQFNWSRMEEGPYQDSITYATSQDLLNWSPSGVILAEHASVPGAVVKGGVIFVYFVDVSKDGLKEQLGMVRSSDGGRTWSFPKNLEINGLGNRATADPAAIVTKEGNIRLYYFDINETRLKNPARSAEPPQKIYSAISSDGINFTQEPGVRFEYQGAFDPDVIFFNGNWYMYTGDLQGNKVNVATAKDGFNFIYHGVAYQGGAVPDVWYEDGKWYLFTAGIDISIGSDPFLFKPSGYHFSDPNFLITADPSVIKVQDNKYLMFYKVQR